MTLIIGVLVWAIGVVVLLPLRAQRAWDAADAAWEATRTAALEAKVRVPLAGLVAEAERKVIAEFSPLAGDPRQVQVVANRPDPHWQINCPHPPIEITAIGDTQRSFLTWTGEITQYGPRSVTTNTTHYVGGHTPLSGGGGGGVTLPNSIRNPLNSLEDNRQCTYKNLLRLVEAADRECREFTRDELRLWEELEKMLDYIDRWISIYQQAAARWSG